MSNKSEPSEFTILYFAGASSFTRKPQEKLPAPLEMHKLFGTLEERYRGITKQILKSCLVTVNQEYVDVNRGRADDAATLAAEEDASQAVIKAGDEVAIIPPVSSG